MIKKILWSCAIALISISTVFADENARDIYTVWNDFRAYANSSNTAYWFKALSSSSFLTNGMAKVKAIALIPMRYNNVWFNMLIYWNKNQELARVWSTPWYSTCNGTNNVCIWTFTTATLYNINNWHTQTNGTTINLAWYYTNDELDGKMTRFAILKISNWYSANGAFCMIYDTLNTAICEAWLNANPRILNNWTPNTQEWLTNDPLNFDIDFIWKSPRTTVSASNPSSVSTTLNNGNYCPSVAQLMAQYSINYNTWLCYATEYEMSWYQIIWRTTKTIFETFTDLNEFNQWNDIYAMYCKAPNTQETCMNAFTWNLDKYQIVASARDNWAYPKMLWNYCNMWLNYDPNTTTCVWSWILQREAPTREEIIESMLNWDYILQIPNENSVINQVCPEDDPNCMKNNWTRDVFGSLENIYNKITTLFKTRSWVNGILPNYIMWLWFVIILFTVLFKK